MPQQDILDISWKTILKLSLTITAFYFLYQIVDILILFVFAVIIYILFSPAIDYLERRGLPKNISVLTVYFSIFGAFSFLLYLAIPAFSTEFSEFSRLIPTYFDKVSPYLEGLGVQAFESMSQFLETIQDSSQEVAVGAFNALSAIFGGVFTTMFVLTMAIFLSLEGRAVEKVINLVFPEKEKNQALVVWRKAKRQVTNWFLVRILACLFVGIISYITFYLFDVQYALLFSLIAGLFNFIPYIGPIVAAGIFFVVILMDSAWKALFAVIAFGIIQIIEGSALTPILSKKYMGVSPVLVLIALTVGGTLWGFMGAFLAIPLLGIIFEFFTEFLERRKNRLTN
jgi:predicted PurR-regulated permease PerM